MNLAEAAACLRAGGVGAVPTETLYGLVADATSTEAISRLVEIKGREPGKPIGVLVDGVEMVEALCARPSALTLRLAQRFWPGPLTIVLDALPCVDERLTGGTGTLGVRVSSAVIATELVTAVGRPLTAPSANPAGRPPARSAQGAFDYFGDRLDFYIDDGPSPGTLASTVVDARGTLKVLREGAIRSQQLEEYITW